MGNDAAEMKEALAEAAEAFAEVVVVEIAVRAKNMKQLVLNAARNALYRLNQAATGRFTAEIVFRKRSHEEDSDSMR